jgi:hypothetical protein
VYDWLAKKYGADSVHIATSDKQAPLTSPFSYADKVEMMTKLGIPAGHIHKVKNPYQATEITASVPDPENTVLIFAVSEKDMQAKSSDNPDGPRFTFGIKRDGTPSFMQPMPDNTKKMQPFMKNGQLNHAYVVVAPTVPFRVKGADANSASEIRQLYIRGNDADKNAILADLYGDADPALRATFDQRLGTTEQIKEFVYEIRQKRSARGLQLLERVLKLERQARHVVPVEDVFEDYIDEKWSNSYKKTINCANPKGFSQKAHCSARKKRAAGGKTKSKPVR